MPDIKYSKAVYRDKTTGELHTIHAESLRNPNTFETAKLNTLYDDSEQIVLTPRFGDINAPHFAATATGERKILSGERNMDHDNRVNYISTTLASKTNWTLGMINFKKKEDTQAEFTKNSVLSDYRWGNEINRIMNEKIIVRHDVFGSSKEISMSVKQPAIAIEVINTHYPEEEAFLSFLEKSKQEPFIVFFDVIKYKDKKFTNYFIHIDSKLNRLAYRWCTYSIRQGKVYKGNNPTTITTSVRMRIEIEGMLDNWK